MNEDAPLLTTDVELVSPQVAVLRVAGEIDLSTHRQFGSSLQTLAGTSVSNVIIDTSGVTFMDSTGLNELVDVKRTLHESGMRLVLVCSTQVRRILELVFPERLFAARVDSLQEAFEMFDLEDSIPL